MLGTRLIACLDIDGGRVVKGVKFQNLRDAGDPVEAAANYEARGADEIVILDVSATEQARATAIDTVAAVRGVLSIPLTVGGGVRSVENARVLLTQGADRVAINTAAVADPELISAVAREFGVQCTVVAIDAARSATGWDVVTNAGTRNTGIDAVEWARRAEALGAGEVLLTSFDNDGTRDGYDTELLAAVSSAVSIPVVASGGAGQPDDLVPAVEAGAAAVLVASLLHDAHNTVDDLKGAMRRAEIVVRT